MIIFVTVRLVNHKINLFKPGIIYGPLENTGHRVEIPTIRSRRVDACELFTPDLCFAVACPRQLPILLLNWGGGDSPPGGVDC